jgi:predicted ATPase/signal transduction histidine kinase
MFAEYRDSRSISVGDRFVVSRALRADGREVVIKTVRPDHPDPRSAELLRHEYELLRHIGVPGVAKPLSLEELGGGPALVLEDAGPRSLGEELAGRALPTDAFLELAIEMATIVGSLHRRNVIHRDICPANFVLAAGLTLVDFDVATAVPGFAPAAGLPGELEGTIAYMAPEQTGRMRRTVDHRADLYSLGATFHEMLTGAPPFPYADPLELVHAHVARAPYPPAVTHPGTPTVLSDIVLKLLSKMPEWRYQTAEALRADLQQAQRQWQSQRTIASFELGRRDVPFGLFLAGKLYGREEQRTLAEQAIERVLRSGKEVFLVTGPTGIGKSALVLEIENFSEGRCLWLSGKSDLLRGNVPYAPIIEAFRGLMPALVRQPEETVTALRERVRMAVAPNGRILTNALPDLQRLIGEQPPLPEVGPIEAENRFHLTFGKFVRALTAVGPPIVLFVDDLQWSDPASLRLLRSMAVDPEIRSFLLLGAYRSEEVGPEHPVFRTMAAISAAATAVHRLELGPLEAPALTALLEDALRVTPERASALAEVVHKKTAGNPFFVRQFLGFLHREGLLVYHPERGAWTWDLVRIDAMEVTPNVVELLETAIEKLPRATRQILETAACIGNQFELGLLAKVGGKTVHEVATALWPAIKEGLLLPRSGGTQRAFSIEKPVELGTAMAPAYQFVHDRIQQAAYRLLTDEERSETHLRVGRRLLEIVPEAALDDAVCPIADQLDRATDRISEKERLELAKLNHRAGRKARADSAYASALGYFRQGLALLPKELWRSHHELWFALQRSAAECAALAGEHELCERLVGDGLSHTQILVEKADLYSILVQVNALRGTFHEGARRSREGLSLLGFDLPRENLPAAAQEAKERLMVSLRGRSPLDLLENPLLEHPEERILLQLLLQLSSAWFVDPGGLFKLVAFSAAELTIRRGHTPVSPVAYAWCAHALTMEGEYARAYEFGQLSIRLASRFGDLAQESRCLLLMAGYISPWRAPLAESTAYVRRAFEIGVQSGELEYASYARVGMILDSFYRGEPLDQILVEVDAANEFFRSLGHQTAMMYLALIRQVARSLKGVTRSPSRFDDHEFDQESFLAHAAINGNLEAFFHVFRVQVCTLMGNVREARSEARESARLLVHLGGQYAQVDHVFYTALALASLCSGASPTEKGELLAEMRGHLGRLEIWADNAPMNFQHKRDLVAAEIARLEQRPAQALALYQQALESAGVEGVLQDEALAHELCGRFHLERREPRMAALHLQAAHDGYAQWGATAKGEMLERELRSLQGKWRVRLSSTAPRVVAPALDYATLFAAAEAVTGELVLDRLLAKMTRICLEAAAAQRAVLILDEGGLTVRATASALGEVWLEQTPLGASASKIPVQLIEHVLRARETLALGDAAQDRRFADDRYLVEHRVRSILAVPIRRADRILGLLYFENNLSTDAFSPQRAEMFRLLSSQLGIALENAGLYQRVQEAVRARDEFLSLASHELRTPVTSLKLAVQATKQKPVPPTPENLSRVFTLVDRQISALSRLIDQMLDVGQIKAGRLHLERSSVDLVAIVRDVVSRLEADLQRAGCPLELRADASVVGRWDRGRIDQVVTNLLSNAIKFGAGKPIDVAVLERGAKARLSVTDRGIGVAPAFFSQLFQKFERAVSTHTYGGLGLGLFIVRTIVEAHGGTVWAESPGPEKGATFVVELPREGGRLESD